MRTKALFAVIFSLVLAVGAAQAQNPGQTTVPRLVQFSGAITNSASKPASGTVSVTFALYKDEVGGDALWVETQNVHADADGHYTVFLGANSPQGLPLGVFLSGEARWLGVQPALPGVGEQPRVLIVGVPYAMKAADADTLGGKPPSAFLLAPTASPSTPLTGALLTEGSTATPLSTSSAPASAPDVTPAVTCTAAAVRGAGVTGFLPIWTGTANACSTTLGQSNIFQAASGNVGIGNSSPAGPLDLTGNAFIRGTLQLPSLGTATSSAGFNSQPVDFLASSFSSSSHAAASERFRWQAEPVGNNTSSPSGKLNLLFGAGPSETGLSIASTGIITFAPGQTFPGSGTGTVTSVGLALTGPLFTVSGSPVTTSGTLTGTLNTQAAHTVFAGPTSGSAAPTFRALTTADLPAGIGTGTVTSVGSGAGLTGGPITTSGTLSVATGGVTNAMLANSSVTVSAGTGLSGGGTVALGGSTTLTNAGVTAITAGTDITTSSSTGNVTVNVNTAGLSSLFAPAAGSPNYIQNGTSPQSPANFNISGTGAAATFNSTNPYKIGGNNVLSVDTQGNVFVGSLEPASNTGGGNTAVGGPALYRNTTGSSNTAMGNGALFSNTTGYNNSAIGWGALGANTGGVNSTAVGVSALASTTTSGSPNTAVGVQALYSDTTGGYNAAFGVNALFSNTTGSADIAIGDSSLYNTTGNYNIAIGWQAGLQLATGSTNILLGYQAGYNLNGAESSNIYIGNQGVSGEANAIRIGAPGPGNQSTAYIAGINGVTVPGASLPVVINANGQLGTGSSGGSGAITDVVAGTGLTGGGSSGSVTLNVDETQIATQTFANNAATTAAAGAQTAAETYASNNFLPLAGGTLTGNLAGTTANFSSTVNASSYQIGGTNVLSSSLANIFVGSGAGTSNTSAFNTYNTAIGVDALENNSTGEFNTSSGYQALNDNSTGNYNTANGYRTLANNTTGTFNTASGTTALQSNTTGNNNTAIGNSALNDNTTGSLNTSIGQSALASNTTGGQNTAIGLQAGLHALNGSLNIMLGYNAGFNFTSSESGNIDIGNQGVVAESNVIRIGDTSAQDSCALSCQSATYIAGINGATGLNSPVPVVIDPVTGQLGTGAPLSAGVTSISTGSGLLVNGGAGPASGADSVTVDTSVVATNASVTTAVAGGVSTAENAAATYANSNFLPLAGGTLTGNLGGTTASFSGTLSGTTVNSTSAYQLGGTNVLSANVSVGNLSVGPDTGNANLSFATEDVFVGQGAGSNNNTADYDTAIGFESLYLNTGGDNNTAIGTYALYSNTSSNNTAIGSTALFNNTTGQEDTASGAGALTSNTTGTANTADGESALRLNTTGSSNTASGYRAGVNLLTGSSNVLLGYYSGYNFTGAESGNIDIGNQGVAAESGVIRIGDTTAQDSCALTCQSATYIAGINGVTVSGGSAVLVNSAGQLGTVLSSRRYKEDIHDMGASSDGLLRLRPVTFRYIKPFDDGTKPIQYGLIAEEVAEVYPDLVVRNKDGQIETVQYYKLDAMLLNEIQKLSTAHAKDQSEIAALQTQIAEQRKQAQEQQAAIKQLVAQVQSIQQTVAKIRNPKPHPQATSTAAKKTTKPATQAGGK